MRKDKRINRRKFLGTAAGAGLAFSIVPSSVLGRPGRVTPGNRINLAYIGMGTQGLRELPPLLESPDIQVVAVCDPNRDSTDYVDWSRHGLRDQIRKFLNRPEWGGEEGIRAGREPGKEVVEAYYSGNKPSGNYKGCAVYADFRELLEKEKGLDAVKIMTPDHLHATIAIAAMKKGLHAATHKPVANFVQEARLTIRTAAESKAATHLLAWNSGEGVALARSWIDSGVIGTLRQVHNWIDKPIWPQWTSAPADTPPVPVGFDWDLWLGPSLERPYHPNYTHAVFRGWYEFGCGILGDMGHYSLWPVFREFGLEAPVSVEATPSFTCEIHDHVSGVKKNDVAFPNASTMRFRFAPRGGRPALDLYWYDGGIRPHTPDELLADKDEMPKSGMLFVGDKGCILGDFLGNKPRLIPSSRMSDIKVESPAASGKVSGVDHWIRAMRGGEPSPGRFENAAALTEMVCLGAVALRTGWRLEWDSAAMKVTNVPEANSLLSRTYRKGWEL